MQLKRVPKRSPFYFALAAFPRLGDLDEVENHENMLGTQKIPISHIASRLRAIFRRASIAKSST